MLKLFNYIMSIGVSPVKEPDLVPPEDFRGLPGLTDIDCQSECTTCADACPTDAISIFNTDAVSEVAIDLGACIQCGLCFTDCPTGTVVENKTYKVAAKAREDLVLVKDRTRVDDVLQRSNKVAKKTAEPVPESDSKMFKDSLHIRVVSTGCSACDSELLASENPIYDLERFGVHIVASPRYADALFLTGPVPKAMHAPLERCYAGMAEPRIVVAIGACAISGAMHRGGYALANGADAILPVNIYVPGCPPHPLSIVHGMLVAMGKMEPFKPMVGAKREGQESVKISADNSALAPAPDSDQPDLSDS
jgi:Ni,Fe-hydrogenase III small subunit/formate hydrogenlyase subunit 6/NADH:ubiquinone oxidoreductase subunit I